MPDKFQWVTFNNVHGGFLGKTDKQLADEDKEWKEVRLKAKSGRQKNSQPVLKTSKAG